ncbi:unnamed protein product [Chrysoparadoxa australica]
MRVLNLLCCLAIQLVCGHCRIYPVPRGTSLAYVEQKRGPSKLEHAIEGLKNGAASGMAAACVKTLLQPFDSIKTVQQFSTTSTTWLEAGRQLLSRGGPPALYSGLGVTLLGSIPSVGIYFGIYQYCKRKSDMIEWMPPKLGICCSAGVGNFIASFFRVPYEVVKQRLQAGVYTDTVTACRVMFKTGGLYAFFGPGGLTTQWARDIPYAIVTLLMYETLQSANRKRKGVRDRVPLLLRNMVIGAVAGGTGSLATNPMDVIKTRMMTQVTGAAQYTTATHCLRDLLATEGPFALLKGATPRLMHKVPANALFFVAYEVFRSVLGVKR